MAKKILIVDDEEQLRNLCKRIVTALGYEARTAKNGRDALEKLAGYNPDLIITDTNMPEMDGISLCQKVRESQEYRNTPIIAVSGLDNRDAMLTAGANDYLPKPFKLDDLESRLKKYLGE